MAIGKTGDDLDALNHFIGHSNEGHFWIGLKKKSTNTQCEKNGCNNELVWADGTEFISNQELEVKANQQAKCFVYEGSHKAFDDPCTTDKNEFLCQYECTEPCKTISSHLCMFPFSWLGKTYNECTDVDYHTFWCFIDNSNTFEECDPNIASCFTSTSSTLATTTSTTTTTTTTTTTITIENCEFDVQRNGCDTGPQVSGITDVASCQNHCKSVSGASHFTLKTIPGDIYCRCKNCQGSISNNQGFISGNLACVGNKDLNSWKQN